MLHAHVCFTLSVKVLGQNTSTRTSAQSGVKIAAAAPKEVTAAPGVLVATLSSVPAGLRYVPPWCGFVMNEVASRRSVFQGLLAIVLAP